MSHENARSELTWTQVLRTIGSKVKDDYELRIRPRMKTGRTKLGSWIEVIGRKIQSETK